MLHFGIADERFCACRYTMIGVCPVLYVGWKILKRSKFQRAEGIDLVKNLGEVEEYEANYVPKPARYVS